MIIDFHTHTFPSAISARVADKLSAMAHVVNYIDPNIDSLSETMKDNGVDYSLNLPVITRPEQTTSVNDRMIRDLEEHLEKGIIDFGGIHPEFEGYKAEIKRLASHGIKGIKLHPPYQGIDLSDIRYKRILEAASEEGLATVIHAGEDIGLPGHNYATVPMILEVIKEVQPQKFVLAHMGGWQDWEKVKKELAGAPVWLDTAFSLGTIKAREGQERLLQYTENLSQEDFLAMVRAHGADRVLFATDSPWADAGDYIEWIKQCGLSEEEKSSIFSENALSLLNLQYRKNLNN